MNPNNDFPPLPKGLTKKERSILAVGVVVVAVGILTLFSGYLVPSWSTLAILFLIVVALICVRLRLYGQAFNVGLLIVAVIILKVILSQIPFFNGL